MISEINLDSFWHKILKEEFEKPYFSKIIDFLNQELKAGKIIYPDADNIFNAFNQTSFEDLNVLFMGQDPYHGPGQAHGLCFSVENEMKIPPSLKNIFKELKNDCGIEMLGNGNLTHWAKQGILMLNAILTVEENKPMSHHHIGWEQFTDSVIKKVSDEKKGIIFVLWGKFAQQKESLIDSSKHIILRAAHPSPFSAHKGFFGCKHFSQINEVLMKNDLKTIDW